MDDPTSSPKAVTNGLDKQEEEHDVPKTNEERITQLEQELEKTRVESDSWAEQYRSLLAKLTTMRTTLGNKLQQDAEELDRREQHIVQLNTTNEELSNTIETLKQELNDSLEDSSNLSRELSAFRQRALDSTSSADAELEQMRIEVEHARRDLESTRRELEEERLDREEFEREAAQERVMTEELKAQLVVLRRDVEQAAAHRNREAEAVQREKEKSANLQSVLEDFQLGESSPPMAELAESTHNSDRVNTLEKEVKEKNLLIGKLRHEAVIMNEHLTIALRKLRSSAASSSSSVDRELVSNILLSFLSAPRTDGTRFEMLTILANVLAWGEVEREKAGLQRGGASGAVTPIGTGIMPRKASSASVGGKALELDGTDETDSFSRMWVEFLLKEANQGSAPPTPTGAAPTTGLSALGSPRAASISGLPSLIKTNSSPVSKPSSLASPTTPNPSTPPPRLSTSSLSRSSLGVGLGVPKRSDATSPLARTELEEQ
ncbi:unnamed protein product [Rhizoctonia solani]|uniref:GRIP domain-containing protein n=1 Tax=Rhizoctonia solani TaxID=456999 RepID=A0A8H3GFH8_9AGAM|nr:unnamed protein product [Rhizoctonia solani]